MSVDGTEWATACLALFLIGLMVYAVVSILTALTTERCLRCGSYRSHPTFRIECTEWRCRKCGYVWESDP